MIRIQNQNLELLEHDNQVDVTVTYTVIFEQIDRLFAANGVAYRERITVLGIDPPGSFSGTALITRFFASPGWVIGNGPQIQQRTRIFTVPRTSLNEDLGILIPDNDEIRCRIEIFPVTPPTMPATTASAFTDQEILKEEPVVFEP